MASLAYAALYAPVCHGASYVAQKISLTVENNRRNMNAQADSRARIETMTEKKAKGGSKPRKTATKKAPQKEAEAVNADNKAEAKSHFSSAIEEAKAGAAALRAEAGDRAVAYRDTARGKSGELIDEAKVLGGEAKVRAGELVAEGKHRASDAIATIGKAVGDTASTIDERLGEDYGDYARKASRSLQEASVKLDAKSMDEIGEDAREFVRKSPGVAVGLAAVAGFLLARLFRGNRD
jgi:ElaB/YqjD/DUF883 family membrane-anchored ribosome-binding protein